MESKTLPDDFSNFDFAAFEKKHVSDDITPFFDKATLGSMGDYEKNRYKNMRKNYEMMKAFGLPAVKPDFMQPKSRKKVQVKEGIESSDSDEEWTPASERQKTSSRVSKPFIPFNIPAKPVFKTKRVRKSTECNTRDSNKRKNVKYSVAEGSNLEEKKHSYPLRQLPPTNYLNLEAADDDHFLYCENCNKEYDGDCPEHGPLTIVNDEQVMDTQDPDRAIHTIPAGLVVKESSIPYAGLGVWTETNIPDRTRFGPYQGHITKDLDQAHSTGYSWQIYKNSKPSHFVDAFDKSVSNWMRYVNCARSEGEQNLTAFQYKGEIYYRTYKTIPAGTELLVWYGEDYAAELGIHRELTWDKPVYVNGSKMFRCPTCRRCFADISFLLGHDKAKHGGNLFRDYLRHSNKLSASQINTSEVQNRVKSYTTGSVSNKKLQKSESAGKENKCIDDLKQSVHTKRSVPMSMFNKSDNTHISHKKYTEDKAYKCDVCGKAFSHSSDFQKHLRIHTGDKPYKCDVCGKAFNRSQNLQTHLRTHTGDKPYKCDVCGKAFNRSQNLQTHLRTHTGDKPYKCDVCGKAFSRSYHIQTHLRTHTGDKPYKCDVCGKAFSDNSALRSHLRIHTGDKPYKCDVCGKAFSQSNDLQTHLRTHTGDKPYKCDVCGKAFSRSYNLQTHLRIHTGDKPYKCDVCGKAFSDNSALRSHLRIHTGDKPYKCDVCGKAFSQSNDLQTHLRTHTGDKPYKCDVCGKAFSRSYNLQTHLRIHTGDKPYKCDVCGKAFSDNSSLRKHLRTHTGDKPYKCDVCGKAFSDNSALRSHLRIHTGDKPYKCDVCGKAFSQSNDLQTHLRTHTGDKPYKCDVCGKTFINSSNRNVHVRTHR